MPKRDEILLLQDIVEAGLKIKKYTAKLTFEDFLNDEKTIDAVIRNFEIIGEASKQLSATFIQQHADIEWQRMIAFCNVLIHGYFGVNYEIVWDVIQNHLYPNIFLIQELLNNRDYISQISQEEKFGFKTAKNL